MSTGERKKQRNKAREIFKEPKNLFDASSGFNVDIS
jgi:hypothetical protein